MTTTQRCYGFAWMAPPVGWLRCQNDAGAGGFCERCRGRERMKEVKKEEEKAQLEAICVACGALPGTPCTTREGWDLSEPHAQRAASDRPRTRPGRDGLVLVTSETPHIAECELVKSEGNACDCGRAGENDKTKLWAVANAAACFVSSPSLPSVCPFCEVGQHDHSEECHLGALCHALDAVTPTALAGTDTKGEIG